MRRPPRPEAAPRLAHVFPPAPGNLPAELNRFVGRTAELAELARRLARTRLVTVTGAGGVGKTRCALRAALAVQEHFCDGVWLVELSSLERPELLEQVVAQALGLGPVRSVLPEPAAHLLDAIRPAPGGPALPRRGAGMAGSAPYEDIPLPYGTPRPVRERPAGGDPAGRTVLPRSSLADHLADRELLLILDGFEHLVDACAQLTRTLLHRAPGLRVLAVGRRPLGITGEQLFPLMPLAAPDPDSAGAAGSAPIGDAAVLFADRAAAVLPGFTLTEGNRSAVAALCHRLDGIPLALELAAQRLRSLSLEQILQRLDARFRLLTSGARGALPRHRTLRTAIGWSHELCTPRERLLWARLSVFAGYFELEAAEYVCSGPELLPEELLDVLAELVAQAVVVREDTPLGVRYRMLETLRAYGAEWLAAMGDATRMRRRHRDWYLGLATWYELDWFSPRQEEVAARVEGDLPNLRAALEFSLEGPQEAHLGQYLAGTLWFYWVGCGRLAEGRRWLDRSLHLRSSHDDSRLKALWAAGYVALLQGDGAGAGAALKECREEAERTGNDLAAAYGLHRTGCLALVSDEMPRAEKLIRAALARYRKIGELNSNVLRAQVELAMAVAFQGDLAAAVELCEEVRRVCEKHGERWTYAYALYVLGYTAWARQEAAAARALLGECLAIDRVFRDLVVAVLAIELLALVTVGEGDPAEAAVLQGAAGRIWQSVGLPLFGSEHFRAPHALCERQARDLLGAQRYEACVQEGARLDLDAAVARALREPQTGPPPQPPGRAGRQRFDQQMGEGPDQRA